MAPPCPVCQALSNGFHFGVEVCSACSAFFRRTVFKKRNFRCWGEPVNCCEIVSTGSAFCKSCRFAKCLAVGMKKETVQQGREGYGKREMALVPVISKFKANRQGLPILETIVETYSLLLNVRICVHEGPNGSNSPKRDPKPVNYKETIACFLKEFYLVGDWLSHCFPEFAAFPVDQKDLLHRNFYLQFVVLEGGFFSCNHKRSDIRYLPSGDYIDCVNPETYYYDPDGKQPMTPGEAVTLFASSFQSYRRNVTHPMLRENADRFEFLALTGLALFDADLENISEETAAVCRKVRQKIQRNMLKYYISTKSPEDASVRLGNLISIIPSLHRATRRFLEDIELSHVMKAYAVDEKFYDNCLPKFGYL
ncbi:Nuclear Hormone Receptor family [Caenorhabditis elegans]|uniref:Nuclear Hormone Receptor family n=1 Tax=Caenorhabditis elegans TaxID=6239 RepID=A2V8C5_CAEEL|nr:Nuclear Hormone Receptor family [Caenorhabditis elegans]CCD66723.1 Nuclear Hormone Receptor family [Caenorhabditis elegans]|eukprot:NP_001122810.1 Nuclear Hormone Receptor family [Caenorhabditis elegans]